MKNKSVFLFLIALVMANTILNAQCGFTTSIAVSGPTAGCGGTATLSSVYTGYSTDLWTQKANINTGRTYAVCFSIGNQAYVGGGVDNSFNYLNDLWEYDPATDSWTQKASIGLPGTTWFKIGFSIGTKGYIVLSSGGSTTNQFYEYNPVTNTWTQKANTPDICALGFSIGSKGYLAFGSNSNTNFYEYDPATDIWTQKANFPSVARYSATGFGIGSRGYIGLGQDASFLVFFSDFYEYNPATNQWATKAAFPPSGSKSCTGFSIGSKGYVGVGYINGNYSSAFWEYAPATDQWTQRASFGGVARESACGFAIGGKGYVGMGKGNTGGVKNDLWEYAPALSLNWSTGSTLQTITVTSPATYSLTISDPTGCSSTAVQLITLSNPVISLPFQVSICKGNSYTINPGGVATYTVSGGSNVIAPQTSTYYVVSGTSSLGCTAPSVTMGVIVNPLPTVSISGPGTTCSDYTVTLSAHGASTYTWSNGTIASSVSIIPTASAVYSVNGANTYHCKSAAIFSISVSPSPAVLIASSKTVLCANESATLTASGSAVSYSWSNGMNGPEIIISPATTSYYSVTGTGVNGCEGRAGITETVSICNTVAFYKGVGHGARIYPNPNNGVLFIETGTALFLSICDITGKTLMEQSVQAGSKAIDISHYPPGIYLLKLHGEQMSVIKLIKSD